jgi:hypothetical protein
VSTRLETAVRDALDELADAAPPPHLAQGAIRRANRQRVARFAVAGVAAVTAAFVAVPLALGGPAGTDRAPTPDVAGQLPVTKPFVVTAYGGVDGAADLGPADDYSLLLDPATGSYEKIPYNQAVPSPDGGQVLVHQGDNSRAHPSRRGLLDRESGKVRWLPGDAGYTSGATWSPDGRQILITNQPKVGPGAGFLIVDVATLTAREVEVPDVRTRNAGGATFVWTPDGKGVALTHSVNRSESEPAQATAIGFYDLAGKSTRTVPVTGGTVGVNGAFSADGSRIALHEPSSGKIRIVDAATGAVRQEFSVPTATVLGWYDSEHLIVRTHGDRASAGQPFLNVVDLTGKVKRTVPFPEGAATAQQVHVGSSANLPAGAEKLAF